MEYQYFEYSAHLIFLDCSNGSGPIPPPIQRLSKSAPGLFKTIADDEIECFIQCPNISLVFVCDRDKDRGGDDDDDE